MRYESFLEAKFGSDSPGSERFKREVGEYHASQIHTCERKLYWAFERGTPTDPSSFKYFELGRLHEENYGAVLAWEYGDFSKADLRKLSNDELVEQCPRVQQDVEFEIDMGDFTVVGESDWVVFEDDAEPLAKIYVHEDGSRNAVTVNGDGLEYTGQVHKVFETKTTKEVKWKEKYSYDDGHRYQLYAYQHAFQSPGEIVYIERNTVDTICFEFDYDPDFWLDCELRLRRHHSNLLGEDLPETTPSSEYECRWCPFNAECKEAGGKVWN